MHKLEPWEWLDNHTLWRILIAPHYGWFISRETLQRHLQNMVNGELW